MPITAQAIKKLSHDRKRSRQNTTIAKTLQDTIRAVRKSPTEKKLTEAYTKLDKAVNYPINSILQININGQWIYYSDLTLDQRVLADHELRDSIRHLLRGLHNS